MKFTRLSISDLIICEPKVFTDERGYFTETFRQDKLDSFLGFKINFCQDNESKSSYGVLRGLHYQLPPNAQTKLIRVVEGNILDVAVDIRKGSSTFGRYAAVELSSANKKQLLVPRGFAHGFVVLSDEAIVSYKVDNFYNSESDRGIAYNDIEIGIDWCLNPNDISLSNKDLNHPMLRNAEYFTNPSILYE